MRVVETTAPSGALESDFALCPTKQPYQCSDLLTRIQKSRFLCESPILKQFGSIRTGRKKSTVQTECICKTDVQLRTTDHWFMTSAQLWLVLPGSATRVHAALSPAHHILTTVASFQVLNIFELFHTLGPLWLLFSVPTVVLGPSLSNLSSAFTSSEWYFLTCLKLLPHPLLFVFFSYTSGSQSVVQGTTEGPWEPLSELCEVTTSFLMVVNYSCFFLLSGFCDCQVAFSGSCMAGDIAID